MEPTLNILVVDDQDVMCEFVRRVLSAQGHRCDVASNGREGLQKLAEQPYDLLILDLIMPGMDGKQTLLAVRKNCPGLPVVIISVQDCERDILHLFDLGAAAYLRKPFTAKDIENIASTCVQQKAAASGPVSNA